MYSFLLVATCTAGGERVLEQSSSIVRQLMPSLGQEVHSIQQALPEIGGGWYTVEPQALSNPQIHQYVSDELAVLVYGAIPNAAGASAAAVVRDAWNDGDIDEVRNLEGRFSAVIIDRREGSLYILSDVIGRFTLRMIVQGDTLLVSPHDLPLVATGRSMVDFNLVSMCSVIACDWSIGGHSLINDIEVCSPQKYVHWRNGQTNVIRKPLITRENRIPASDGRLCRQLVRDMDMALLRRAASFESEPTVVIDVTAGIDSRAALGAVLATLDHSRIIARTLGDPNSLDVSVAKKICEHYSLRHEIGKIELSSKEQFLQDTTVYAFATNGTANCKNAFYSREDFNARVRLRGGAGEVFRGYYYPKGSKRRLTKLDAQNLGQRFWKQFSRLEQLNWSSDEFPNSVVSRIDTVVDEFMPQASQAVDILDYFYLYERFGRWALGGRSIFSSHTHYLYESPELVRLAYQLPAPIGRHCDLHHTAIHEHIPWTSSIPINGGKPIPLDPQSPIAHKAATRTLQIIDQVLRKFKKASTPDVEIDISKLLGKLLHEGVRDILQERDGLGGALFGEGNLQRMIEDHQSGRENHTQSLGFLITMEHWRGLVLEAHRMAKRHVG